MKDGAFRMLDDPCRGVAVAPSPESNPIRLALMNEEGKHDGRGTKAG